MSKEVTDSLKYVYIEIINNKARHNLIDAKCRWRSNRLDGAVSFWEPLGQTKVMQIRQRETQNHQGAISSSCASKVRHWTSRLKKNQVNRRQKIDFKF